MDGWNVAGEEPRGYYIKRWMQVLPIGVTLSKNTSRAPLDELKLTSHDA